MDEKISIRHALAADFKDIAYICRTSLGYDCSAELVRKRLETLDSKREAVFAAVYDDRVVGFVHSERYEVLYAEPLINILGIAVDNGFKRRGIGRMLMQAVEKDAAERGVTGIRLNSGGSRSGAHEFYRSLGFDSEKTQIRFIKQFRG